MSDTNATEAKWVTVADLATLFPQLFNGEVRPLKRGIHYEIFAETAGRFTQKGVRVALSKFVGKEVYLRQLVAGASRYGLDGQPAGEVTEADQRFAEAAIALLVAEKSADRRWERKKFLTEFEAAGLSIQEFAAVRQMKFSKARMEVDKARAERNQRRRSRTLLVRRLRESGLSVEAFAEANGRAVVMVQKALDKVIGYEAEETQKILAKQPRIPMDEPSAPT